MSCENSNFTSSQSIHDFLKPLIIVVYSLVSILAIVGNSAVIFVVFYFRVMHSPNNFLIANLALADLLMAVFCIPMSYWPMLILEYWPFGRVLCKIINFAKVVTVFLSSYTLLAISFDRFAAVMFPMGHYFRLTTVGVRVVVGLLWVWSLAFASPLLLVQDLTCINGTLICKEMWSDDAAKSYGHVILVLQFLLPLVVLIVTYSAIGMKIWVTPIPGETDSVKSRRSTVEVRRSTVKKMIPMMVLVTFLYAACWLPQNLLINVVVPAYRELEHHPHILYIWWICHLTAMSHTVVNPIVYCCKNMKFRRGFSFVFQWLPCIHYSRGSVS